MPYELIEDAPKSPGGYELIDTPPGTVTPPAGWFDRLQAGAAGVTRGAIANLPGIPVDTALNVADLARAAYGYGGSKLGLFPAGDAPQPLEHGEYPGSSEWIAKQEREKLKLGPSIDPNRPDDLISRLAFAGGQGVAPALIGGPTSGARAAGAATAGAASQVAAQGAQEAGLSPEMQVLASFAPALGSPAAAVWGEQQHAKAIARQTRDETKAQKFQQSVDAGYVFPPAQTNPTGWNKFTGGVGGKLAMQQDAALANQEVSGGLARQAVNLPGDSPLNRDVLAAVRKNAYETGYEPVKDFGPMGVDRQYLKDIHAIERGYVNDVGVFETLRAPDVEALIDNAKGIMFTGFDSNSAIGMIRNLRDQASTNLGGASPSPKSQATGYAQKKIAAALEDLVGRELARSKTPGGPDMLARFQEARKTIARSHTLEETLDPTTEAVDATKMHGQLLNGVPLDGPLLIIANAGGIGGPATKVNKSGGGGGTFMENAFPILSGVSAGLIGGGAMGHPAEGASAGGALAAGLPFARHGARNLMLSPWYQRFAGAPTNTLGSLARLAETLPEARALAGVYAAPAQDSQ
jgi:hypothetical protein